MLFRPLEAEGSAALERLLASVEGITVHDTLMQQLRELVRATNPSVRFGPDDLEEAALAHLAGCPPELYGTWAYYHWSRRLVHLLDEAEFATVRTDRNRNKITREEQAVLATKKVGIVGLSVGRSAAMALALERGCGELRIADFDTLDLSNLNRLCDGVHHLGMNKAVLTARQIAELDPYLKVTLFPEGITESNLEAFLTEGGKLDLLIEECDSVAVKIRARLAAKAHRIPVVMDTSDRGLIDVER
ncbi:MAG: ThiF family adenylyltransferase, partial [Flavobacteriales bacterium]